MTQMTIRPPHDWHLDLREGTILGAVADNTACHFARAIITPNLAPPVLMGAGAEAFLEVISPWEREYLLLNA